MLTSLRCPGFQIPYWHPRSQTLSYPAKRNIIFKLGTPDFMSSLPDLQVKNKSHLQVKQQLIFLPLASQSSWFLALANTIQSSYQMLYLVHLFLTPGLTSVPVHWECMMISSLLQQTITMMSSFEVYLYSLRYNCKWEARQAMAYVILFRNAMIVPSSKRPHISQ